MNGMPQAQDAQERRVSGLHGTPNVRCNGLMFARHIKSAMQWSQVCTARQFCDAIVHGRHNAKAIATGFADPYYRR